MLLTSSNGKSFYVWYDAKVSGWQRTSKYQQELLMLILPWKVLTKHLKPCFHIPHLTAIPDSWFPFQVSWQTNDGFPHCWMLVCVVWRCFPLLSGDLHGYGTCGPLIQFICLPLCVPGFQLGKTMTCSCPRLNALLLQWAIAQTILVLLLLQVHQETRCLSWLRLVGHTACLGQIQK